jgi:hypothetical protein
MGSLRSPYVSERMLPSSAVRDLPRPVTLRQVIDLVLLIEAFRLLATGQPSWTKTIAFLRQARWLRPF